MTATVIDAVTSKQCTRITQTANARYSPDHRQYRRWINRVVNMTRRSIKQRGGLSVASPETHRRAMRKLYHTKRV